MTQVLTIPDVTLRPPVQGGPDPQDVRASCPYCSGHVVSNVYYVPGAGYVIFWECWESLKSEPSCNYRRVL